MSTIERLRRSVELTRTAETRWGPKRHWHCVYCGRPGTVVDHFLPEAMGGTDDVWNLFPACLTCNARKMDRQPIDWLLAVGVPHPRVLRVIAAYQTREWIAPTDLHITRIALDYDAGRRIPRTKAPPRGK
jgi:hypothetical protein